MANKQMSGYGLSVSNTANKQVKSSPIQDAQQKTEKLTSDNPNGVIITKFSEGINAQLTKYLPGIKKKIAEFEKIKALGSEADGYNEAVDGINELEKQLVQLNSDLEGAATQRKELLDIEVEGTYAMSSTAEQTYNFHNVVNGTYGEGATISDDGRLIYNGGLLNSVDVGGSYSNDLEDLVEETFSETRRLAYGSEPMNANEYNNSYRKNLENDLNKLTRGKEGKNAVKDYMYQNRELIDAFIANQAEKENTPEFRDSEEYKALYELNKTATDFNDGFVETVLGMHDYILFESKESEEIEPELTAEEIIKKFS